MKFEVLCNRQDIRKEEAELKEQFVRQTISSCSSSDDFLKELDEIWPLDISILDVPSKIKFRDFLKKHSISIINFGDGTFKIMLDNKDMIASWNGIKIELRKDLSMPDPKKRLYAAVIVDYWSVFEEKE